MAELCPLVVRLEVRANKMLQCFSVYVPSKHLEAVLELMSQVEKRCDQCLSAPHQTAEYFLSTETYHRKVVETVVVTFSKVQNNKGERKAVVSN